MKPSISTFDLILTAAKNSAFEGIANRDRHPALTLTQIVVKIRDTSKKPWILFEVLIGYSTNDSSLEPNDDLSILVPWNSDTNSIGEIKGKSF